MSLQRGNHLCVGGKLVCEGVVEPTLETQGLTLPWWPTCMVHGAWGLLSKDGGRNLISMVVCAQCCVWWAMCIHVMGGYVQLSSLDLQKYPKLSSECLLF